MKISLIHPSRGRAVQSARTVALWLDRAHTPHNVEVVVSLDRSDNTDVYLNEYHKAGLQQPRRFLVNDNKSVVEATNVAAAQVTGNILIYLSDDFECPWNWDLAIQEKFKGEYRPLLLKVDDCLQKFDVPVLTIPIMNKALYDKLGYFWHPAYKSMFVDEDLYWTVRKLGALKAAPELKFEHKHVSVGKAPMDDTYRNSSANWDSGKATFQARKAAGFPL